MFMLIDTHLPPDDEGRPKGEPWPVTALAWLLPWPALIVWLLAASRIVDGWAGVGLAFAAVIISAWRGLRALPMEGLTEAKQ
jgi:hypothetical protein